jgi:hypothetical protein
LKSLGIGNRYKSSNRKGGFPEVELPATAGGAATATEMGGSLGLRGGRLRVALPEPSSLRATAITSPPNGITLVPKGEIGYLYAEVARPRQQIVENGLKLRFLQKNTIHYAWVELLVCRSIPAKWFISGDCVKLCKIGSCFLSKPLKIKGFTGKSDNSQSENPIQFAVWGKV